MEPKQLGKLKLYYKGDWNDDLFKKCMGVVGSRRMTSYGQRVIDKIIPQLVFDGWTIVSGFMYGVDIAAHRACLESGGRTIAVLGWGISSPMPGVEEEELAYKIVQSNGLVLSLWENQLGTNWTFPARNTVVAKICHELIVVEAAAKSGALLSAGMMRALGKKVWAVPGPITSSVSSGTNRLIANNQATPWIGQDPVAPTSTTNPILLVLQNEGLEAGEISRKLKLPMEKINAELALLTLSGQIIERQGKYSAS